MDEDGKVELSGQEASKSPAVKGSVLFWVIAAFLCVPFVFAWIMTIGHGSNDA